MPKQFLDGAKIRAGIEHVGGEGVAQCMGMHPQSLCQLPYIAIDNIPDAPARFDLGADP